MIGLYYENVNTRATPRSNIVVLISIVRSLSRKACTRSNRFSVIEDAKPIFSHLEIAPV